MKIGFISDIHIDINEKHDIYGNLKTIIEEKDIDIMVVVGDISNKYQETIEFINNLEDDLDRDVFFVPGNHDLFSNDGNTIDIYNELVKSKNCISNKIININEEWVMIGDTGWYDYSFGSSSYSIEEYENKFTYKENRLCMDGLNIRWNENDININNKFLNKLKNKLDKLKDKKVIVVTHMVTNEEVLEGNMNFSSAFKGSTKYKELFNKYDNIKYSIMGHVHSRVEKIDNEIKYISVALKYDAEWAEENCYKEIEDSIFIIEI